jgi:hypothetical protein
MYVLALQTFHKLSFFTVSYLDFGKVMNEAWFKEVGHIKDKKEREAALQYVTDWWLENRETLPKGFQNHSQTIINTMRHATNQFTSLVSGLSF